MIGGQRMQIRIMTIQDYEGVYRLWRSTPGMGLNTTDDSRAGIQQYLNRNPNTCFVAEDKGEIVGVILAGHDGRRGMIHHTAVSSSVRNQGIGTALIEHAMRALECEGIHKVALTVFAKNEAGDAFWENRGFTKRTDLVYRNKNITELTRIDT